MGVTGLELGSVNPCGFRHLRKAEDCGAAESGAVGIVLGREDPELTRVVVAWRELPEAVRVGIVAMVEAAASHPARPSGSCPR